MQPKSRLTGRLWSGQRAINSVAGLIPHHVDCRHQSLEALEHSGLAYSPTRHLVRVDTIYLGWIH